MNPRACLLLLAGLVLAFRPALRADVAPDLLEQARAEAPGELQLHIAKTSGRLDHFLSQIRKVEQVPGWSQVRVEGDAAFAAWDALRKDFVWHGGKFEVVFDVVDGRRLKLASVTFNGETSRAEP